MGQDVRQDWAITLPAMHALMQFLESEWMHEHALMQFLESEWMHETSPAGRELVASIVAYSITAFCGSCRGSEVFLTDLHGLRKHYQDLHYCTALGEIQRRAERYIPFGANGGRNELRFEPQGVDSMADRSVGDGGACPWSSFL